MPQNGFHALFGAAVSRRLFPNQTGSVFGFTLGSMLPDADIIPMIVLWLAHQPIHNTHRNITHSLFFAVGAFLLGVGLRYYRRAGGAFLTALALGTLAHAVFDVFFWFSEVDLLWPLGELRGWPPINIWHWLKLPVIAGNPDLIGNELSACEAVAFALYLGYVYRLAKADGAAGRLLQFTRVTSLAGWVLFPIALATGIFLPKLAQNFLVYGPNILLFFPTACVATIAFRHALAQPSQESVVITYPQRVTD